MPTEGLIVYYDLEHFCEEHDFQGRMNMLGATQGVRLQLLATHIAVHGAMEITTAIVLTFRDLAAQIHAARIEVETVEVWDASTRQRAEQVDRAEQAALAVRAHLEQRLPLITRFASGIHVLPGMLRDLRDLHTIHQLFTIVRLRPGDPHSPRSFKLTPPTRPTSGELDPAELDRLVQLFRAGGWGTMPNRQAPEDAERFWYMPGKADTAEQLLEYARTEIVPCAGFIRGDYVALTHPLPALTILARESTPIGDPARQALGQWLRLNYDITAEEES